LKQENKIKVAVSVQNVVDLDHDREDERNAAVDILSSLALSMDAILFVDPSVLISYLVVCLDVLSVFGLVVALLQFEEKCWRLVDDHKYQKLEKH